MNKILGKRVSERKICRTCNMQYVDGENWCVWCYTVLRPGQFINAKYVEYFLQVFCSRCGADLTTDCFLHVYNTVLKPTRKRNKEWIKKELKDSLSTKFLCWNCGVLDVMQSENCSREEAEELWDEGCDGFECSCPL